MDQESFIIIAETSQIQAFAAASETHFFSEVGEYNQWLRICDVIAKPL